MVLGMMRGLITPVQRLSILISANPEPTLYVSNRIYPGSNPSAREEIRDDD